MPRLYGAPAYTRPRRHVEAPRPFDPDDLPLEAHRALHDAFVAGGAETDTITGEAHEGAEAAVVGSSGVRSLTFAASQRMRTAS
jgi:hypothetical protein